MEGKILGNRYELLEKIGGGGMALVYKAKCRLLNRFVAVKILRPEFINDEEFVKRFKIEAQAAASLSHPNIVSIYDVGHEEDVHYIIMEFVHGITLKDYILQKKKLPWKEAVKISIQICSAIEHAHRNHIVHRDIKPHNILFTEEGIVKVTDFGIARAVSSSTITMVGSTIGSVHYFSPEQARGGYTDEKSDLYSLGIALYEMVTGRLPFDGETPVAIALKHIQDQAVRPVDVDESVPSAVNDIIMKAIKKEQNKRYQTASEMLQDLNRVLTEPEGSFVKGQEAEEMPTKRVKTIRNEDLLIRDDPEDGKKKGKKGDKLTVWLAVATSAIIIILFTYVGYKLVAPIIISEDPKVFKVQNYVGKNIDEVQSELEQAKIQVDKVEQADDQAAGTILSQNISEGRTLAPNGSYAIKFVISKGPTMVKLPDLSKQDYRTAENTVVGLGLVPQFTEEFHDTLVSGLITRTEPEAGESVKEGSTVVLYKSKGPEIKSTKVPDLKGKTMMDAQKMLSDAKLKVGKIMPEEGKNHVDKIVNQNPAANSEVNEGSGVDIYFEAMTVQRKIVNTFLPLSNMDLYGDKIKVLVEVTPSDTNKMELLINNEMKNKSEFPLTLPIPVPENGSTKVTVYLDGNLFVEFPMN